MNKLKIDYRKMKDKHNKTGENRNKWECFDATDAILGHRPTTRPPVVLDTSEQPEQVEERGLDENEEDEGILPQSYNNRAFWHDFQGIPISYMEACLALKLHSLKLCSLNG